MIYNRGAAITPIIYYKKYNKISFVKIDVTINKNLITF